MINRKANNCYRISLVLIIAFSLSLSGLYGCGTKTSPSQSPVSSVAPSASAPAAGSPSAVQTSSGISSLKDYIGLIGMSKEKLTDTIKEKPDAADEGGLDFKDAGIRVWFDAKSGTVNQVFTQNKSLDLNGVKIGDKVDAFKDKFGTPVSDKNGDMHFKYGNVFLSVNYDTKTNESFALYILDKDF